MKKDEFNQMNSRGLFGVLVFGMLYGVDRDLLSDEEKTSN